MTARPPIEYASADSRYDHLRHRTGLPIAVIRELVAQHRISELYDSNGLVRTSDELRDMAGGPPPMTGREALEVVRRKRLGPAPISPTQAKRELLRLRHRALR
jgi:hypothetical protein